MQTISRKLLIVKPPYQHFPVGIAYVLSCLERNNIPFDFVDAFFTRPNYNKLLKKNNYLAFATGGLISNLNFISQTIKIIRSIKLDLPIILGGNITKDINPEFLFNSEMIGIDFGVMGEAETSLPCLVEKLSNGSNYFKEVPGLIFRDKHSGEITKNLPKRFSLEDTNALPAWHHINMDFYKHSKTAFMANQVTLPLLTGRGCVGSCTFCSPTVGAFRKRPIEHIMEEIEFLFSKYNFDKLHILNEVFYQAKEDILVFCKQYKKLKTKKPWICGMRVDVKNLDDETFMAMKDAGCVLVGMGIESGSNKILNIMKKRITKDQVINFCRGAKKAKLPYFGNFMVGNEDENEEDVKETIDMVINEEMNTDASLTDAYPGTQIYRSALNRGLISDEKEYYKNIHFNPNPYDLYWENRERYLNISAIPNEHFWDVIFTELRRYYTFSFNRFKILHVKYKINWITNTVKAEGICSECNNPVKIYAIFDLLGQLTYCQKCHCRIHLNYYELKKFCSHFELLCTELKRTKKLVVVGVKKQAMNILRYDHFGLNYGKIKGFLDFKKRKDSNHKFAYMLRLQMEDLVSINPDAILIADDQNGNAESKLKNFYSKNKLDAPVILYLLPDRKGLISALYSIKRLLKRILGVTFVQRIGRFCVRGVS